MTRSAREHVSDLRGIVIVALALLPLSSAGQDTTQPRKVEIPTTATTLEGIPIVRIDSAEGSTTRRVLSSAEALKDHLTVKVVDGQLLWASRGNRPLRLSSTGEFTYLSSEPGKYIRLTRLNDRISYVEHLDTASGHITWWGELSIIVRH